MPSKFIRIGVGVYRDEALDYTARMEPLSATPNPFGGIVLEPDQLPDDPLEFAPRLKSSLKDWTEKGYKVVWLEIPLRPSGFGANRRK